MPPTIEVSQAVHDRLKELAGPLFSVSEVITRLLDTPTKMSEPASNKQAAGLPDERLTRRAPRERGAVLKIGGHRINAVSVRDMYEQVLRYMVDEGIMAKIEQSLPYRTSNQRYLVAKEPIHPNKNDFVVPVGYKGYYMEAHKNYENAIAGLQQIAKIAKIRIEYVA